MVQSRQKTDLKHNWFRPVLYWQKSKSKSNFYLHKVRKIYNEGPRRGVLPFAISKSSTQRERGNPSLRVENQWSEGFSFSPHRNPTTQHREKGKTLLSVLKINEVMQRGVLPLATSKSYHSTQREGGNLSPHRDPTIRRDEKPCRVENQHDKGGIPLLRQNRKDSTWEGYPPIALKLLGVFVSR